MNPKGNIYSFESLYFGVFYGKFYNCSRILRKGFIEYKISNFILTLLGKLIGKESSKRASPYVVTWKTKQNASWFTNYTRKIGLFFTLLLTKKVC